jgi:hypothetical protein
MSWGSERREVVANPSREGRGGFQPCGLQQAGLSQSEHDRAGLDSREGGLQGVTREALPEAAAPAPAPALLSLRCGPWLQGRQVTFDRLVMAYPGYGGGVSPGRFAAASAPRGVVTRGGARVRGLPEVPSILCPACGAAGALVLGDSGSVLVESRVWRGLEISFLEWRNQILVPVIFS